MKRSDTLNVRMSELRTEIRALMDKDTLTDEERTTLDAKATELRDSETKYRAALSDEAATETEHRSGSQEVDPEVRQLLHLGSNARVHRYLQHCVRGSALDGVEKEYNEALGLGSVAGCISIPTELICADFGEDRVEERADAITDPGIDSPTRRGRFLDRILGGDSFASRIGVTFDNVGVGMPEHILMTGGTSAVQRSPSQDTDAGAATFDTVTLKPSRQTARYVWRIEDVARFEGLEAALRRDIRRVMAIKMDTAIFDGANEASEAADDITGLLSATGVPAAANVARTNTGATFTSLLDSLAGLIDGLYAKTSADLSMVFSPALNQELIKGFPITNHPTTARALLAANGFTYGVNDRMSKTTPIAKATLIGVGSKAQYRQGAAVAAMWPVMQAITDPYSGAGRGEIALTVHALWNFKVVRGGVFWTMSTVP